MADKLCIDCKWMTGSLKYAKCNHYKSLLKSGGAEKDFVTGEIEQTESEYQYCSIVRKSKISGRCGKEGKYFESKNGQGSVFAEQQKIIKKGQKQSFTSSPITDLHKIAECIQSSVKPADEKPDNGNAPSIFEDWD